MNQKQNTLKEKIVFTGVGLHTGKTVSITLMPAPEGHGIQFHRTDILDASPFAADISNVVSTQRGTTLNYGESQVWTVEHLMSALIGCNIDNVLIQMEGPEIPIMDGSALPFTQKIKEIGIQEQDQAREYFSIDEILHFKDEISNSEYTYIPSEHLELSVLIDFNSSVLGQQYSQLKSINSFTDDIAPARTFVFVHEIEHLLDKNLIKGGDLDNAVVIADRMMTEEELLSLSKKLNRPGIKVEKAGVLNTTSLRYNNEPARHKLLDLLGDLSLLGKHIKGSIVAVKPGHTGNLAFAKYLRKHSIEQQKIQDIPRYNPNQPPIMDVIAITKKLPHRYPFLLVDKIIELTEQRVVGIKNVTFDEPFFIGHFPDNPIMPGVLQIEAMAQTGGILALANVPDNEKWDTYFLKIDNAKFKQKVVPGDTLIVKLELLMPIRRGIVCMNGKIYIGNKLVSEADLTAQIVKRS